MSETERYIVRQGDHLRRLAHARSVSPESIWEHPDNAELREQRESMEALLPGDILHMPAAPATGAVVLPNQANRYRAHVPTVEIPLTLRDGRGEPLANASFRIDGAGTDQTDGDGRVTLRVGAHVRDVRLIFDAPIAGLADPTMRLRVGHLDPIEAPTGIDGRLENLGYFVSRGIDGDEHERAFRRATALRDFQRAAGLEATGEIDDATRDALREAHGS